MPQMAPIMWVGLYLMFFCTLVIINLKMYFFRSKYPETASSSYVGAKSLMWEW